jgi:2-oxoglutarate ferredoxin oxidoreductase subunit gamma
MERFRILFSGSGGQGVITASILLAEAAVLYDGLNAVQAQTYGPEARGGATRADVIISDREIRFPKVTQPNVLICLTQQAYNKFSETIRPGGLMLIDSHFVKGERNVDARQIAFGMYKAVMETIKKPIVFNICVLGTLIGLTDLIRPESIIKVLEAKIPAEFLDINLKAFEIGLKLSKTDRADGLTGNT